MSDASGFLQEHNGNRGLRGEGFGDAFAYLEEVAPVASGLSQQARTQQPRLGGQVTQCAARRHEGEVRHTQGALI